MAGAVRQKDPGRLRTQHFFSRSSRGNLFPPKPVRVDPPQNIGFDTVIVGDNLVPFRWQRFECLPVLVDSRDSTSLYQSPFPAQTVLRVPVEGFWSGDLPNIIRANHEWSVTSRGHGFFR